MNIILSDFKHGLLITVFVFVMMIFVDYLEVVSRGGLSRFIKGSKSRQYVTASFLGALPGCLGSFMNVSFYIHGLISFGAIVAGMVATCGDEAFVMLAMFPQKALFLFGVLFMLGIVSGYGSDALIKLFKIQTCKNCQLPSDMHHDPVICHPLGWREILGNFQKLSFSRFLLLLILIGAFVGIITGNIGPGCWDWKRWTFLSLVGLGLFIVVSVNDHYLETHIWQHIAKKHLLRIFLWSFGALLAVDLGLKGWNLEGFIKAHMVWVVFLAGLLGIIPESGPHLIFVMMFARGLIPFSVLLASSIVQDGHGMLPLFSYSLKDSLLVKLFNLIFGLGIGLGLYALGF